MGAVKGNKKSSKRNRPKRIRYNMERRGEKHRESRLRKHLKNYPNDKVAQEFIKKFLDVPRKA